MISASTEFVRAMQDNHTFKVKIDCTLMDGTQLTIDNSNIRMDSLSFEKAISDDASFDIGSFIVGKLSFTLNNIPGTYNGMDFDGAVLVLSFANQLNGRLYPASNLYPGTNLYPGQISSQYVRIGTYTVVDTDGQNGAWISLIAYDNACKFQVPLDDVGVTFPATASALVGAICNYVGVTVASIPSALSSITIPSIGDGLTPNCLQAIAWCAMLCGTNATINPSGQLVFKWYNTLTMASVRADIEANGWDGADLSAIYELDALNDVRTMVEDVNVTGIAITYSNADGDEVTTPVYGTTGYVINLSENAFVNETNAETVAQNIANNAVGMKFRPFEVVMMGNPLFEPGDIVWFKNRKGQRFLSVLTSMSFTLGEHMNALCGAEAPEKRSAQDYSATTRVIQQTQTMAKKAVEKVAERVDTIEATAVTNVVVQYAVGDNATTAPTSGWSSNTPTWQSGKYVWQRTVTTIDGEQIVSNATCIQGAKGERGAKGEDGTSVTIRGHYDTYAELIAAHPTGNDGDAYMVGTDLYVWTGSKWEDVGQIQGPQGATGPQGPQGIQGATGPAGANGADGVGIRSITPYYYLSTSNTAQTGGSWSTTPQSYVSGCYYWIKSLITWDDGTTAWTATVLDNATTDANSSAYQALRKAGNAEDIANATKQYFWTDTDGVHISSEADAPTATRNALWNTLGMLFRKGANAILGILTGNKPSVVIYDGLGNLDSNIVASFSADGVVIGLEDGIHSKMENDGFGIAYAEDRLFDVSTNGFLTNIYMGGSTHAIGCQYTDVQVAQTLSFLEGCTVNGTDIIDPYGVATGYTLEYDSTAQLYHVLDASGYEFASASYAGIFYDAQIKAFEPDVRLEPLEEIPTAQVIISMGGIGVSAYDNVLDLDAETIKVSKKRTNGVVYGDINISEDEVSFGTYDSGSLWYRSSLSLVKDGQRGTFYFDSGAPYGGQIGIGNYDNAGHDLYTGMKNISNIGDGTITGAISSLAPSVSYINGSSVSVPSGTATTIASITLKKGKYLLTGACRFSANSSGYRALLFSASGNSGSAFDRFAVERVGASQDNTTYMQLTWPVEITTTGTTIYLNATQSSGSTLTVDSDGIKYVALDGGGRYAQG